MLNVHMLNDGIEWCFCGVWSDGGGSCKMVRRGRKWGGSEGWTSRWRGFWVRSGMWLTWCAVVGSWSNYKRIRFVQWFVVQWRHFVCDRNCLQWRYRGYHHRRVAPAAAWYFHCEREGEVLAFLERCCWTDRPACSTLRSSY